MTASQWIGVVLMFGGSLLLWQSPKLRNSGSGSLFGDSSDPQPNAPENKRPPGALPFIALLVSLAGLVMLVWPYFT
jgi:drug/metabolite transporter (DMT)-like permease